MKRELRAGEVRLVGQWLDTGSRTEGDAVAARIEWLTGECLLHVARAG